MIDFTKLTDEELFSIWDSTNGHEWNDLLGEKPEGFDELPDIHNYGFFRRRKNALTKSDYTYPIWRIVNDLLPEEKIEEFIERQWCEEKQPDLSPMEYLRFSLERYAISKKSREAILEHFSKIQD